MMSYQGWNCMRHGVQYTATCAQCEAADQKLREEGYRRGYADALEAAAKLCFDGTIETQMLDWDLARAQCAEAIRKLKDQVQR